MKTEKTGFSINHLLGILIGAIVGAIIGNHCLTFGLWTMFVAPLVGALTFLFVVAPRQSLNIIQESWGTAFQFAVSIEYRRLAIGLREKICRGSYILTMSSIAGLCVGLALSSTTNYLRFVLFGLTPSILTLIGAMFFCSCILSTMFLVIAYCVDGLRIWNNFRKGFLQASVCYLNFIMVAFWMLVGMYFAIKWLLFTAIPWITTKLIPMIFWFTLRFSIEVQSGLCKHGLALGTLSTAIGAFIGQFQNSSIVGGAIGCGIYCIVHLLVWCTASFAKAFPQRLVYEKVRR